MGIALDHPFVVQDEPANSGIYFCPDGEQTALLGRRDFSDEKKQAIRALHGLDKRWNVVVLLHYAIWLTCGWIAVTTNSIALEIAATLTAGLSLSTLAVLTHESCHNLFTRNPRIDRWIGFICGTPVLFSANGYRIMHPLHHKHLRTGEDPDDIENVTRNSKLLRFLYVFVFFFAVYLYLFAVPANAFKRGSRREKLEVLGEFAAMVAIVAAGWVFLPANVMLKAWLIPLIIAGQVANIRGIAEHGLTSQGNELINARTITTTPLLSFLMCNINYHLEHHLYPGVPWYRLPQVNEILREEYARAGSSVYPSYTRFLWDVSRVLMRGVKPGTRLIPEHIRDFVCL